MANRIHPRCDAGSLCYMCYTDQPFSWISREYKFIYYETPKCGSSTIKRMIEDIVAPGYLKDEELDGYFSFSFVRNPWDRMVSLYHAFFLHKPDSLTLEKKIKIRHRLFKKQHMTFEEFIECLPCTNNHHWEQASLFIPENVDFIGRFETYKRDLNIVLEVIGFDADIPHIAKTEHGAYTDYYKHKKHIEIVRDKFPDDIERFGYSFGDDYYDIDIPQGKHERKDPK